MVKDYLIVHGGVKNVVVERKLIKSCSLAYSKYEEDVKQKKSKEKRKKQQLVEILTS